MGAAYPFKWNGGWANVSLGYKHTNFPRASRTRKRASIGVVPRQALGVRLDRRVLDADRNHGDDFTAALTGKRGSFLVENEAWWRAVGLVSVGSNVRVSRNVYATDGRLLVYPTARSAIPLLGERSWSRTFTTHEPPKPSVMCRNWAAGDPSNSYRWFVDIHA